MMNHEIKVLTKKLTALCLSVVLVLGLLPSRSVSVFADSISCELYDYEETYYNGFNDNVAVATGTAIILEVPNKQFFKFDEALPKEEGASVSKYITINNSQSAEAIVTYEDGDVVLSIEDDEDVIFTKTLYTPKYVDISEMDTISYGETKVVSTDKASLCEKFYRINKESLPSVSKVFTIYQGNGKELIEVPDYDDDDDLYGDDDWDYDDDDDDWFDYGDEEEEDDEYEPDTVLTLYDKYFNFIDENDDAGEACLSELTFSADDSDVIIVGVKGYEYSSLFNVGLKIEVGAKAITKVYSDNAEELNVFYKGFNDNVLIATGTSVSFDLDNGETKTVFCDYSLLKEDDIEEYEIPFEWYGINAYFVKNTDGSIGLNYKFASDEEEEFSEVTLFTPKVVPFTQMPALVNGEQIIATPSAQYAYKYYKLVGGTVDQVWKLQLEYKGDLDEEFDMGVDVYNANGEYLYEKFDDKKILNTEVEVPAGEIRVIGIYTASTDEIITLINTVIDDKGEVVTGELPTDAEPTTEEPTTEETTTVAPTTVAPIKQTTELIDYPEVKESSKNTVLKKAKIKKVSPKKKASKKIKLSIKKFTNAKFYKVQVSKTKKFKKKDLVYNKNVKKVKVNLSSKKFVDKSKLFVRVKALDKNKKAISKWSKYKKVKIKK